MLTVLILLILIIVIMALLPVSVEDTSISDPAIDYDDAMMRVSMIRQAEQDSGEISEKRFSEAMTHGEKTEKAIIVYHGFTSCPEQFRELGKTLFERGYNVFIPRIPHHGKTDRLVYDALADTSAEELAAFATETIDIGRGLGDELIIGGLSGGGTIATWVIQEHDDVEQAIIVAPFLGIGIVPTPLNRPIARILDDIPNFHMWWNPRTKENNAYTLDYQYPGYAMHALAEYLRLGYAAQDDARDNPPGVKSIIVITNKNDAAVDNNVTEQFVNLWQSHSDELVTTYEFEKALGLPHDLITPTREDGDPALVYPIIIQNLDILE
ncbi:MAG: alpha/beta fold hydrolase [Anaerolineae bacterium]|nr:alpha/beta fold hydrolase [Anaerolineae bacterium]